MLDAWIGVDLDGTLAKYNGWQGADYIGEPIALMMSRVQTWLREGRTVKIFTARISHDGSLRMIADAQAAYLAIERWCLKHIGQVLPITNVKDYGMVELWDDRCVQVEPNTGIPVQQLLKGSK